MIYLITSATKLSPANLKAAVALAAKELGASGTPTQQLDPSLLAGVKIQYGSSLLDLSLSSRLDRLTNSIS